MTTEAETPTTPQEAVARWFKELDAAKTREKTFRTTGQRILDLYDGTDAEQTPFNILYSNTETLAPALYSTCPIPVVDRRFKDADPLGKHAAEAGTRVLKFLLDTNLDEYATFDQAFIAAVRDALLPGRAWTSLKYDNEGEQGEGEVVCPEIRHWKRVWMGYALTWTKVPWLAYEEFIDKEEATRLFGHAMADKLQFRKEEPQPEDKDERRAEDERHQGERQTCRIYQIWDKDGGRKVRYVSDSYKDEFLLEVEDPLELSGFFNCPMPLQFFTKTHSLIPTALYVVYESQAKELNELTRRIKHVTKAIKARGIYDSELGDDLKKLMQADENELVPADKSSSLAAEKGLQNAIWFMPLEQLIATLTQLYQARESCKQVIYEITGISDILRGASKASETLGAQQIKTQWGSLRLKTSQSAVQRYAVDLLRMTLEIAALKFSEETWAKMTGLPFLLSTKYNELTKISEALQQQLAAMPPPMAPAPPMPGAPPPGPPPVPPQVAQLQQIQQQLQAPQWSQVLALLKNDLQRAYRIDIETNSTIAPEAAEDQKNIQDVLMTLSQVLQGLGPLVANGTLPFEAAQILLLTIVRRYRFGAELEDTIQAMQPPKPQDDGAAQAAMAQKQLQMQHEQNQADLTFQQKQGEMALQEKAMHHELGQKQREMGLNQQDFELQLARKQFAQEQQAATQAISLKAEMEQHKLDLKKRSLQWEQQHKQTVGAH